MNVFVFLGLVWMSAQVRAADYLQILHTSDLHSQVESCSDVRSCGSYRELGAALAYFKSQPPAGVAQTLTVDAGDFSEGSLYFFAANGVDSYELLSALGYDLTVVGNHDYVIGESGMAKILKSAKINYTILSANLDWGRGVDPILAQKILPYKIFTVQGRRIAIMGLTIGDMLYKWALKSTTILDPIETANSLAADLKDRQKVDAVIVLSHLGQKKDRELAAQSRDINLIISAHTHEHLSEVLKIENEDGAPVSIVQVGKHGEYLGQLLLDLSTFSVASYQTIALKPENSTYQRVISPTLEKKLVETEQNLAHYFTKTPLNEVVAQYQKSNSNKGMFEHLAGSCPWGPMVAQSMHQATSAHLAIHVGTLGSCGDLASGDISRAQLYSLYPRVLDFADRGWNVWTVRVNGAVVKKVIKMVLADKLPVYFSGLTYDLEEDEYGQLEPTNILVDGRSPGLFSSYTIAVDEGVVRGALGTSMWFGLILRQSSDSGVEMWDALEKQALRMNHDITSARLSSAKSRWQHVGAARYQTDRQQGITAVEFTH